MLATFVNDAAAGLATGPRFYPRVDSYNYPPLVLPTIVPTNGKSTTHGSNIRYRLYIVRFVRFVYKCSILLTISKNYTIDRSNRFRITLLYYNYKFIDRNRIQIPAGLKANCNRIFIHVLITTGNA